MSTTRDQPQVQTQHPNAKVMEQVRLIPRRFANLPRLDGNMRTQLKREGRCFSCREPGHRAADEQCIMHRSKGRFVYADVVEAAQEQHFLEVVDTSTTAPSPAVVPVEQKNSFVPAALPAPRLGKPRYWSDMIAGRKSTHPEAAPITKILDTTELLENVLEFVPAMELFVVQRTCKTIRDTIHTSPTLKHMIDPFKTATNKQIMLLHGGFEIMAGEEAEKLREQTLPAWHTRPCTGLPRVRGFTISTLNHLLLEVQSGGDPKARLENLLAKDKSRIEQSIEFNSIKVGLKLATSKSSRILSTDKHLSYRDQQLTRPPVKQIKVIMWGEIKRSADEHWYDLARSYDANTGEYNICNEEGVRFGQVVDEIAKWYRKGKPRGCYSMYNYFNYIEMPGVFPVTEEEMKEIEKNLELK